MNVLDMLLKPDKRFAFQQNEGDGAGWKSVPLSEKLVKKFPAGSALLRRRNVRGIALPAGSRIVVKDAALYWPHFAMGQGIFQIRSTSDAPATLVVGWHKGEAMGPAVVVSSSAQLRRFEVPPSGAHHGDLVIAAGESNTCPVFLGVYEMLNRAALISRLRGRGVEIGPGPRPQALPTWRRKVSYVEQATPDAWQSLYGRETPTPVNRKLWDRYVVGTADNIPAEEASLDFIFSSHVVEHLANPLGHLAYWAKLLKPGGLVVAVIPDKDGCQDYAFAPSTVAEIMAEWEAGSMQVTIEHYRRWGKIQMPGSTAEALMESGRSIHVHFYTPAFMANLLAQTVARLGFQRFTVTSQPNHKDFHVVLEK
jgi:SAM-dependent methyltransferase